MKSRSVLARSASVILLAGSGLVGSGLAGCGSEGDRPPTLVRDSAGIEIVESLRPRWGEGEGWRVGSEALLRIGVVEGDAAYQFDGVVGATRLADGTVVVADGGYQEVRFFDSEGRLKTTFGGPGEGPEEFSGLLGLGVDPEGGIWAFDFRLRRITWLDQSGAMQDLTVLGPEPVSLRSLGVLPDGTFLLKQPWGTTPAAEANEMGLRRDPVAYVRFDAEGSLVDTLGTFPGRQIFITEDESGRDIMGTPPFDRNSVGGPWEEGFVEGSSEAFEVVEYSAAGEALRVFRLPDLDLALAPEDREEYILGRLEGLPAERRPGARGEIEAMPFPDTRPAYGAFVGDDPGNLWISEWAPYPQVPERWTILDSTGAWLGTVVVPSRFSPYHIGEDWILGVEKDELDVEYVVLYPLLKGVG